MISPDHNDDRPLPAWLAAARNLFARIMGRTCHPGSRPHLPPFTDRYRPGVCIIESSRAMHAIAHQATDDGLAVARLNGAGVTSKAAFLAAAARDLQFPDYFGHNWDAFADCLGDFAAAPAPGTVLILDHYDDFARAAPHDWQTALTILNRATMDRHGTDRPFFVFLHGSSDVTPTIPAIDGSQL